MELERLLQKNAAITRELTSDEAVVDQEISPEWYRLCNVHMVHGSTINFVTVCYTVQGESIQPLLEASSQVGSKERGAQIKVRINVMWIVLASLLKQ